MLYKQEKNKSDIVRLDSSLLHGWEQIEFESDICQCRQIVYSPASPNDEKNATKVYLNDIL